MRLAKLASIVIDAVISILIVAVAIIAIMVLL